MIGVVKPGNDFGNDPQCDTSVPFLGGGNCSVNIMSACGVDANGNVIGVCNGGGGPIGGDPEPDT